MSVGVAGSQDGRIPEAGQRIQKLPLAAKDKPQALVGFNQPRPKRQRLTLTKGSVFQPPQIGQGKTQVVMCLRIARADAKRLAIAANRLLGIPLSVMDKAQVIMGLGVLRLQPNRLLEVADGCIELLLTCKV
jgi:hypothetical protein